MEEFFIQYGVFLAKSITIFILFVFVIAIAGAAKKDKQETTGEIIVKKLNNEVEGYKETILDACFEEIEREKEKKREKKSFKSSKKELKKSLKQGTVIEHKNNCFVLSFIGDRDATDTDKLAKEITAVLAVAKPSDEVVVKIESPGGSAHCYGFGASQILRVKEHNIPVTICVDKVAASGGYMMACVGDKLISAPFAIVGSIGVVAQMLNINKILTKNDVEVEHHTAGEFKTTLTLLGKNTKEGREKFQEQMEEIHILFKDHVKEYRPQLDMKEVATGEFWFGKQAIHKGLVDAIQTSDAYLMNKMTDHNVYSIAYKPKLKMSDKLSSAFSSSVNKVMDNTINKLTQTRIE